MSSDWESVTLGEVADIVCGFAFPTSEMNDDQIGSRVLSGANIGFGEILWQPDRRWTRRPNDRLERFELAEGDVVIGMNRPVVSRGLKFGVIRGADLPSLLFQRVARVRGTARLDPTFARSAIASGAFRNHVNRVSTGSTLPVILERHVREFRFYLPPLQEQRRIAGVLGALDDKIEHNRALAERLAAVASAGFALFAARWAATEQTGVLSDLGAPASDRIGNGAGADLPYIGLDAMPRGSPVLMDWTIDGAPTGQASRFAQGDILFGKLRPYFKKVGIAPIDGRCSTEILVLRPTTPDSWGPLFGWVLTDAFIAYCVAHSVGTKMPRSEWRDVQSFPVPLPSSDDAARCTSFMRSIFDLVIALVRESQRLTAIRDALLPSLVSGKLRVPESYNPEGIVNGLAGSAETPATAAL